MVELAHATSTQARLHAEHKARLKRLHSLPKRTIAIRDRDVVERVPIKRIIYQLPAPPTPLPPLSGILQEVAKQHRLAIEYIVSRSNKPKAVAARMEFCYLAVRDTKFSLSQIGHRIGRHHATVVSAIAAYCDRKQLPVPREQHTWTAYRKRRQERYGKVKTVECPTSEQFALSRSGQHPRMDTVFRGAESDSRPLRAAAKS
jgi:hypothetical protein